MMSTLDVFWDDQRIGHLDQVGGQAMTFRYAESYLASQHPQPISLSLPLQAEAFAAAVSRSWFANLLPEGEIRGHVARRLGVSERNEFALLAGIGGECAGALRLLPESMPVPTRDTSVPLPWAELEAKIASTPRPSLLALVLQDGELRLSLAGAQDKLPVRFSRRELALPGGNAASTHLVKVSSGGLPDLVQNELLCLTLAGKVGLAVPPAEMAPTRTPILLVERYDRRVRPDGSIGRLHQEDFCQALGVPPDTKYESEGGPSLVQLFEALSRGSRSPLPDKKSLLEWVLFNVLIGNADAHAKNISLLYGGFGERTRPRLAPFYDLVCTQVYAQLSTRHAQKIGGEYRFDRLADRHWERFATSVEVHPKYLRTIGLELCDKVERHVPALADDIGRAHSGAETLGKIVRVVESRIGRIQREFGG